MKSSKTKPVSESIAYVRVSGRDVAQAMLQATWLMQAEVEQASAM